MCRTWRFLAFWCAVYMSDAACTVQHIWDDREIHYVRNVCTAAVSGTNGSASVGAMTALHAVEMTSDHSLNRIFRTRGRHRRRRIVHRLRCGGDLVCTAPALSAMSLRDRHAYRRVACTYVPRRQPPPSRKKRSAACQMS